MLLCQYSYFRRCYWDSTLLVLWVWVYFNLQGKSYSKRYAVRKLFFQLALIQHSSFGL